MDEGRKKVLRHIVNGADGLIAVLETSTTADLLRDAIELRTAYEAGGGANLRLAHDLMYWELVDRGVKTTLQPFGNDPLITVG